MEVEEEVLREKEEEELQFFSCAEGKSEVSGFGTV